MRSTLLLLALASAGCKKPQETSSTPPTEKTTMAADASSYAFSGTATMEPDGTIVLELSSYDDRIHGIVHGVLRYPTTHPQYASIAEHVGPLAVGETKPVKPWD